MNLKNCPAKSLIYQGKGQKGQKGQYFQMKNKSVVYNVMLLNSTNKK